MRTSQADTNYIFFFSPSSFLGERKNLPQKNTKTKARNFHDCSEAKGVKISAESRVFFVTGNREYTFRESLLKRFLLASSF